MRAISFLWPIDALLVINGFSSSLGCHVLKFVEVFGISAIYEPLVLAESRGNYSR